MLEGVFLHVEPVFGAWEELQDQWTALYFAHTKLLLSTTPYG